MEYYFYKGFQIKAQQGVFVVLSPAFKGKILKITRTSNEAKEWIEKIESKREILKSAREMEKYLKV